MENRMSATLEAIPFAKHLRIEALPAAEGAAHLQARVLETHTNRFGTAHGGFLNALADTALEIASNSHDVPAVTLATSMQYHKAASVGQLLDVQARETHLGRTTATYHIEICSEQRQLLNTLLQGLALLLLLQSFLNRYLNYLLFFLVQ